MNQEDPPYPDFVFPFLKDYIDDQYDYQLRQRVVQGPGIFISDCAGGGKMISTTPGSSTVQITGSLVLTLSTNAAGNPTLQVDNIDIFGSFSRADDLSSKIQNLGHPIVISKTGDSVFYGEAAFNTSAPTSPPTVTTITFKQGAALPAGGNLEYINVGTSPKVNNVQSICRFTIATGSVDNGVLEVQQCITGTVWGITMGAMANLSAGGTPFLVNCVCLGAP